MTSHLHVKGPLRPGAHKHALKHHLQNLKHPNHHFRDVEDPDTRVRNLAHDESDKTLYHVPYDDKYRGFSLPDWTRPCLAEMFGIMTMTVMGYSCNIQANLTSNYDTTAYSFGWGVGLMMGLLLSIPISGGHLNPSITISQAIFRGFPWRRVPFYIFFQILGAFVGAIIVNGVFYDHLNQIMGAMLLFLSVAVVTDPHFGQPMWVSALIMMWTMTGVSGDVGINPPFALNPARDLGPRLACAAFGYPGHLWGMRNSFWVWGCGLCPIIGAVVVTFIHDLVSRGRVTLTIPHLMVKRRPHDEHDELGSHDSHMSQVSRPSQVSHSLHPTQ